MRRKRKLKSEVGNVILWELFRNFRDEGFKYDITAAIRKICQQKQFLGHGNDEKVVIPEAYDAIVSVERSNDGRNIQFCFPTTLTKQLPNFQHSKRLPKLFSNISKFLTALTLTSSI